MKKFDFLVLMMIAVTFSAVACFAYSTRTDYARRAVSQSPSVFQTHGVNTVSGNPVLALDKRPLFSVDYFTSNFGFDRAVNLFSIPQFFTVQPTSVYPERSAGVKYQRILYDKRSSNFKVPLANQMKPRSSPTRR